MNHLRACDQKTRCSLVLHAVSSLICVGKERKERNGKKGERRPCEIPRSLREMKVPDHEELKSRCAMYTLVFFVV